MAFKMGEIITRCMVDAGKQSLETGSRRRQLPVSYMAFVCECFSISEDYQQQQAT